MERLSKRLSILLLMLLVLLVVSCGSKSKLSVKNLEIIHESEFGGVYIKSTIEDFNKKGFKYGDSVTVKFSNDYTLKDIPYYNGYYTANGEALLIAYKGYDYIKCCINNGDDLWEIASLDSNIKASITLNKKGKYLDIEKARDISYTDIRDDYTTDEEFANFRAVSVSGMKTNILYRSASPCDNQHNRAPYVDDLIEEAGVQYILNLADTEAKISGYMEKSDFESFYFKSLYESGNVCLMGLNMNYSSDEFISKIVNGISNLIDIQALLTMSQNEGPYLVHCTEGKDRTGFMCILFEALVGATYQEIVDDYMITYDNYYKISPTCQKDKYDVIISSVLNPMIKAIVGDVELENADYQALSKAYLVNSGMSEANVDSIINKLKA